MADIVSRESPRNKKQKKKSNKIPKIPKDEPRPKVPNKDDVLKLIKDGFGSKIKDVGKTNNKPGIKDSQVKITCFIENIIG